MAEEVREEMVQRMERSQAQAQEVVAARGASFVSFVIDHGLGPVWHDRLGRPEFHASRMAAESLFLAQQDALANIDSLLTDAGIDYVLAKPATMHGLRDAIVRHNPPSIRKVRPGP